MIQGILDGMFNVLEWLTNFFPVFDTQILQLESILTIFDLVYKSSFFVPWSTVFICMIIVTNFYSIKATISVLNWLIDKIPFI